jgi:hypothetical protein
MRRELRAEEAHEAAKEIGLSQIEPNAEGKDGNHAG